MSKPVRDLPDINVWIALSSEDHVHHKPARRYWEQDAATEICFCRLTMLGLLRLVTNSNVMSGRPFSIDEAWSLYEGFRAQSGVVLIDEPSGFESQMKRWSDLSRIAASRLSDCALAAWADAAGCRIVSFDRDYAAFQGLSFLRLTS